MRGAVPLLGVILMASVAEAGPLADPAPWVLPVNAFARAKVGDWTILEGDALLRGKMVRGREIIRVAALGKGVAEVQLFEGPAGREGWFLSFPVDLKRGPDTNLLFDVPWIAVDMTQDKATCTLGDASFPCTRVTYRTTNHRVTVFMAARVKGSGIVSFEVLRPGSTKPVWTMKTIGYGNGTRVEWGVGPPRADLEGNWDGGAAAVDIREGSQPATEDVYQEDPAPLAIPPRVDLTGCKVRGDRDRASVERFLQRKLIAIEDCYAARVAKKPKLGGGAVTLAFNIDELAAVTELVATGGVAPPIRVCLTDAVEPLQFPFSDGGGVTKVECAFTFDPGKPAPPRKKPAKRRLISKGHPARGGPDLRGLPRIP